MNQTMFAYRRQAVVPPPYPANMREVFERDLRLVVTIVGHHDSFVSGLHIGQERVASYHRNYFYCREALIGNTPVPITKVSHLENNHHVYELAVPPDSSLVAVDNSKPQISDFVFQIGVRRSVPNTISVGIIEPLSKYVAHGDQMNIDTTSESGSGVFNSKGALIGMTLGVLAPDTMAAIPILDLYSNDGQLPRV